MCPICIGLGPLPPTGEDSIIDISEAAKKRRRRRDFFVEAAKKRSSQRAYFVYARYHHLTALLGTRTLPRARRVVRGLGQRYPLPGLKFWCQPVATPHENVAWPALHEIIVNTLARPESERGSVPAPEPPLPGLNEKEAAQYLRIKLDDLRREINIGRLTCEGPRRNRRFFVAELDRWLTNTRTSRL
jgi:excisionase family DNA binding protein